ncbi:siderophore-interacting protein [Rhizobium sp. RAF56]|uniref:siderophore-interacting protein n=1 Tax=Rhizobium sp. RAF56 TaxID=3233062 RepID=UPI003F98AF7D
MAGPWPRHRQPWLFPRWRTVCPPATSAERARARLAAHRTERPHSLPKGDDALTIRNVDLARGELDIDFVIHESDNVPGAAWDLKTRAGDRAGLMGPGRRRHAGSQRLQRRRLLATSLI